MPTQFMKLGFEKRVVREDGFYNTLSENKVCNTFQDIAETKFCVAELGNLAGIFGIVKLIRKD